ncbi:SCP2 domain-containing protein [Cupriavidus sp. AU9028]|uniref:ubiquinone biosynthesis accessory factor UbiJ n=1 Tax=Cupriavidus sp. AU9028 TaxID=2871157 RepID=UPI001C982AB5|nr:SCP2 sterol-binding domain-containing protein [Cupriavidus sp. AU9028]MBY4896477.1 SCP2 sterol-binding domain-containing protein [Cupriavidus sp. AU9028]
MNLLPSALLTPLITALNHLLEQEPWARQQLAGYAGRVIGFDAAAFALSLRVEPDGRVAVAREGDPEASVILRVPLQQWPLVAADIASGGQAAAMRHVRLEGDAELANTVSGLARHLRWDAAEDLSRALRAVMGNTMGDGVAQRVVDGVQQLHAGAIRAGMHLLDNVTEYLLDEQPTLVRHVALAEFSTEVAVLRDDLARLEKRLERLERLRQGGQQAQLTPLTPHGGLPSAHR